MKRTQQQQDQMEARWRDFTNSIEHHAPNPNQIKRIESLREEARSFAAELFAECWIPSREFSLALTHLEETVMWAVKAIVLEDDDGD